MLLVWCGAGQQPPACSTHGVHAHWGERCSSLRKQERLGLPAFEACSPSSGQGWLQVCVCVARVCPALSVSLAQILPPGLPCGFALGVLVAHVLHAFVVV